MAWRRTGNEPLLQPVMKSFAVVCKLGLASINCAFYEYQDFKSQFLSHVLNVQQLEFHRNTVQHMEAAILYVSNLKLL